MKGLILVLLLRLQLILYFIPSSPRRVGTRALSAHLLQHLADVLAPEDEEDDDDQQQDDGHQTADQDGRLLVFWRVRGRWAGF